jgi:hypothetical protein
MRPLDWYSRAKERIERFLPHLDEDLEVDVDMDVITPNDGSRKYTTFVLSFSHPSNPNLNWTMQIRMDDAYIEQELEGIVTKIYLERVE